MAENTTGAGALSRRDFLTGSAVAAAGAAMLALPPPSRPWPPRCAAATGPPTAPRP